MTFLLAATIQVQASASFRQMIIAPVLPEIAVSSTYPVTPTIVR